MIFEIALSILYKKLGEKETVVIAGEFNGPIGCDPENYEDQHESYGYGIRNKEEERLLEFCAAMNMIVWNTLFGIKASHLTTYEFGPSKTNVSYCWVRKNQGNFSKNI